MFGCPCLVAGDALVQLREALMCRERIRIELDAAFQRLLRLGRAAEVKQRQSKKIMGVRGAAIQADGLGRRVGGLGEALLGQAGLGQPEAFARDFPFLGQGLAERLLGGVPAFEPEIDLAELILQVGQPRV